MSDDAEMPFEDGQFTQEVEDVLRSGGLAREAVVEVIRGPDTGRRALIITKLFRIGSDPLCDLVLSDPTTSRRHCEIRPNSDGYLLQDLGSTNGTFVDELRLGEIFLDDGVIIRVGNTLLRFHADRGQQEKRHEQALLSGRLIGVSSSLQDIFEQIAKVAPTELSVIIEGETGTGKELVARAIHAQSTRAGKPIIVFDCSAFPPTLIESELFGHEKGAFSGALGIHRGVFERAHGGTILFDELGEMDVGFQGKFLRALETGELRRVGGERTFQVDVRILAATNRRLEEMIEAGQFRQDLFYRLAKLRIHIPPLRERATDIPPLVQYFLESMSVPEENRPLVTPEGMDVLCAYLWPGNVRELRNIVERAAALCEGGRITGGFLRQELGLEKDFAPPAPSSEAHVEYLPDSHEQTIPLRDAKERIVADFERRYLVQLLEKHNQNVSRAAREAKIDRRHFYRLLKKYELMD